jgi:NADPH:quinone reductase-like Zn-dependent oxidoreductase
MRAWHIGESPNFTALTLTDGEEVPPGPSEVVMRTRAVSLNYRDLLIVNGRYHRRTPAGTIPCSDAAGEIVATGSDVSHLRVGDRVVSCFVPRWQHGRVSRAALASTPGAGANAGVLAERIVLPQDAVVPMPRELSFEEASTLPCAALTAWHALFEPCAVNEGDIVLALGTGGVSMFAVQFAARAGATVIATSSSDEKLARLSGLGVSHTINYRDVPLWGERARELAANGEGVDHVIEVGGQGTLEQSLRAVRPGGTISLIGTLARPAPVSLLPVLLQNIRLQGVMTGSREMFTRMNHAIEQWNLTPIVDRVFAFEDAPSAYEYLSSGRHFGKVVIRMGRDA